MHSLKAFLHFTDYTWSWKKERILPETWKIRSITGKTDRSTISVYKLYIFVNGLFGNMQVIMHGVIINELCLKSFEYGY